MHVHCFTNNKKASNKAQDVDIIKFNNLFSHWLKETDSRRYPDNIRILPTNNTVEIDQYAAQELNHFLKKSPDDIRETVLYEKKLLT